MQNDKYANMNILNSVRDNNEIVNQILNEQNLNAQNLKKLISAYEMLFQLTSDIKYQKNIADIYYYYFNDKDKALKYYTNYVSKIHNDSAVYHILSSIYKSKKDNINYKKYFEMALTSSAQKISNPIPVSEDLVLGVNIGVAAGISMNDDIKYGV